MQIAMGFMKLGKYINYLPYSVISGFMSGIGVILIIKQFNDFLGYSTDAKSTVDILYNTVIIAVVTLVVVFVFPLLTKAIPSTLVALIIGTSLTLILGWDVRKIGEIMALPDFKVDDIFRVEFSTIGKMLFPAFSLAALGMIDTLLTAVIADKITKTKHNSNRELIGQGIGNIGAALVGGIPGAGTTVVTVTNIKAGGTSRLSGVVQALFLVLVLVAGTQLAAHIPYCVLAGLLISIGVRIMDYTFFKHIKVIPKSDLVILVTVFILTVTWSLLYATAIGLVMATIFFMKRMADVIQIYSKDSQLDRLSNKLIDTFEDADDFRHDVYVKALRGPMFFGSAYRLENDVQKLNDIKCLIIDMRAVPYMDQTGAYSLRDITEYLHEKHIKVAFSGLNEDCYAFLKALNVIENPDLVPDEFIFASVEEAVIYLHKPGVLADDDFLKDTIEFKIPEAFTPNEDGENDVWELEFLEDYPSCTVKIFNKGGVLVFDSIGYKEPWDARKDGEKQKQGIYTYEIKLKHRAYKIGRAHV